VKYYLGIDLGGTKTSVSVGRDDGSLIVSHRMPTNADTSPEDWRRRLDGLITAVLAESGTSRDDIVSVGLAVPGPMRVASGTVLQPPNMPGWRDVPVRSWIEAMTGRPVVINNDANAAALAEYRFGEYRGTKDLVYVTMSTGIGAGIISGGHLLQGADDLAGEVGHMVVRTDGPSCSCGQQGCWEMYCGGRNVALQVQENLRTRQVDSVIVEEAGGDLGRIDFACIERAIRRNDTVALQVWKSFLDHLAHGIGILAMCFNPRVILLGTIAVHMRDLIWPNLDLQIRRYAWRQTCRNLVVRPTRIGHAIGDLGALALALQVQPHPESQAA